jgi:hypothetical protein
MTLRLHGMFGGGGLLIANRCNKGLPLPQSPLAARLCDVTNRWRTKSKLLTAFAT